MDKPPPKWYADQDATAIRYGFFISHVGEDSDAVKELKNEIQSLSGKGGKVPLDCFLDAHDWPSGNENIGVIQEFLLKSSHVVLWASPSYLDNKRGWVWIELAYAELIEQTLNYGANRRRHHSYIAPIYRNLTANRVQRTPLIEYWTRALVRSDETLSMREIAQRLVDFHHQEARKRLAEE